MSDVNEGKLATIRAILAKAEDPAATEQEAALYLAKATELMARYGVDRAMLAASDPSTDVVGDKTMIIPGPFAMAKCYLINAIGEAIGVKLTRRKKRGRTHQVAHLPTGAQEVHLYGMRSDIERLEILFTSLLIQCHTSQARDEKGGRADPRVPLKVWRRDYMQGFANRVWRRIKDAEERARAEYTEANPGGISTDLVVLDRAALVKNHMESVNGGKVPKAAPRYARSDGFDFGDDAGRRADLGGTRIENERASLES